MEKLLSTKQFIISHFLIFITGLFFISAVYLILNPEVLNKLDEKNLINYIPVTRKSANLFLEINNPEDNLVVFEKSLVVSGKTIPNAPVVISTDTQDFATQANNLGEFSKVIELGLELNNITIVAFNLEGSNQQTQKTIYYSQKEL